MELMAIVTTLCVCLSFLLTTPCAAKQLHEEQSSYQQAANDKIKFSVPALPRKLRVLLFDQEVAKQVQNYAAQGSTPLDKQKGDSTTSGKPYHKEQTAVHGGRPAGTWREWVEENDDTSHFFTMDYTHVRRRRPIHNKSLPAGP